MQPRNPGKKDRLLRKKETNNNKGGDRYLKLREEEVWEKGRRPGVVWG